MRDQLACDYAQARRNGTHAVKSGVRQLHNELLSSALIPIEDWERLPAPTQEAIANAADLTGLLALAVRHGLLTEYQANRIGAGKTFGMVLGNYRVLDRLGAGGMGIVFRAEHLLLRRQVAIKVLAQSHHHDARVLLRFIAEMRAVSLLHHPNIVGAFDAGKIVSPDPTAQVLHYLVMEYVPGKDLEEYVILHGPLPIVKAIDLVFQVADALGEAHKHHLVHRDIKPPNIMVTPEDRAKLLDFGLVHHFCNNLTVPSIALGTVEYMAPEQARDASSVDIRADIFGLGGILYFCLTGRTPYPTHGGGLTEELMHRLTQPAPSARSFRPEVPIELDRLVAKMMALNPAERFPTPEAVMEALLPFLKPEMRDDGGAEPRSSNHMTPTVSAVIVPESRVHRALVVDDEPAIRDYCRFALEAEGIKCDQAADGKLGWEALCEGKYDLALLDVTMPELSGPDLCRRLRERPPSPHFKILMISGAATADEMSRMMLGGADDYLAKPFSFMQLQARVKVALRLKDAQERSELLNGHLLAVNRQMELSLTSRDSDLVNARNGLVLALAKCVEYRDGETGSHLMRLQHYTRRLAEEAAKSTQFATQIDANFIELLECAAPLHDLGKVGLPDHILLNPGKLAPDERILMQAHTVIGSKTLKEVAEKNGFFLGFLQMAIDIARHHHERFDGTGYPDHLSGSDIPLPSRIVAIADVYDALRSRRVYKPALSHTAAVQLMTDNSPGQFDPALMQAFRRCAADFERIRAEYTD